MARHAGAIVACLALALLLGACATGPRYDTEGVRTDLTPQAARESVHEGESVLWGGRIIETRPGEDTTELELLAYPLNRHQEPDIRRGPEGRFLITYPEFLEPGDWATGRMVTVTGELAPVREGHVGEARYRYPVVEAREMHLWPREEAWRGRDRSPQIRVGIGVIYSR